jgi:hypothetical protein
MEQSLINKFFQYSAYIHAAGGEPEHEFLHTDHQTLLSFSARRLKFDIGYGSVIVWNKV